MSADCPLTQSYQVHSTSEVHHCIMCVSGIMSSGQSSVLSTSALRLIGCGSLQAPDSDKTSSRTKTVLSPQLQPTAVDCSYQRPISVHHPSPPPHTASQVKVADGVQRVTGDILAKMWKFR